MSTTETAPQKQGGCNRIKTVLQRESKKVGRGGGNEGIEKDKERKKEKRDKEAGQTHMNTNSQESIIGCVTRF